MMFGLLFLILFVVILVLGVIAGLVWLNKNNSQGNPFSMKQSPEKREQAQDLAAKRFCSHCGAGLQEGWTHCPQCGAGHREELYFRSLYLDGNRYDQPSSPLIHLPVMDVNDRTANTILSC